MAINVSSAEREKQHVAFTSVAAAVLLTSLKLVVGILTGSLGILAEAAHSTLDLVAALVTFLAVRLSGRPPDDVHNYGHGKIENLSALVETLLLLATCVWIIYEAIQRLFFRTVHVEISIWAFVVMVVSILVDITRSRMLYDVARKYKSQALEADALHFSTDIWSSTVVIIGLMAVWLGGKLGPGWAWLAKADAGAALAVAVIVVHVSVQLGRRTISVLLDSAPAGLTERVADAAGQVPGVVGIGSIRIRQAGAAEFADLVVNVDRSVTLEEAHLIATAVEERLAELIPEGDVVVHVEPVQLPDENLTQAVRAIAARFGLRTHNIHSHELHGAKFVDLDVEVPAELTLDEAHQLVSQFEASVRRELPSIRDVNSHIEPAFTPPDPASMPKPGEEAWVRAQVEAIVRELPGLEECVKLHIRHGEEGYDLVVGCTADPSMPIIQAHRLADQLERRLQASLPDVGPVLVHVEPRHDGNTPG